MTSQELVTSKSHNSQDHHGDLRSRLQRARDARLPHGWAVSFHFPVFLFFFFKVSVPFSCLTPVFVCKCNTDVLMTAHIRRLQICFRSSWLRCWRAASHRSRRWRTRRKGRRRRRKKKEVHVSRERERERERERREKRSKQKPGALVNLMWRFLFFCQQSTSRKPRSRMKKKKNWDSATSFPIRPARLSFLVNWQDVTTVCMTVCLDGNGNSWTRSPMLRLDSNFSTASRQSTCLNQERSGDRMFVRTTAPSL